MKSQTENPLSVVVIAKNEQENLPRLLKSISWADEILIADTGSSDQTREIAAKFGARVIDLNWKGFGITKHQAVEAAKHDWILSLDADEEVSEALKDRIIKLQPSLKNGTAYKIRRISQYLRKNISWCGWQNDAPVRLFNRQEAQFNDKQVHEGVKTKADIRTISEPILHYTYPYVKDHWDKINFYTTLNTKEKYNPKCHYTVTGAIFHGIWKFVLMYFFRQGFRDGKKGFILCLNSAIGQYIKYLKLWEKHDIAHRS